MRFVLLALLAVSGTAIAHPGHDQMFHSSLLAGLAHPLTGLDHLMMGLGLGLLMARTFRQSQFMGLGLLLLSLVGGFWLGMQHVLASQFAEYGIVASLLVLAMALWQRASAAFLPLVGLLGVFHGMAHGYELPLSVNPAWFMLGMLASLGALYLVGSGFARLLKNHINVGERVAAVIAGLVAALVG